MDQSQLPDNEWLELYRHLLERLKEHGFHDCRQAIDAAVAEPVSLEGSDEGDPRIQEQSSRDLGRSAVRQRLPFEALSTALDVIWTCMVEMPLIAAAAQARLVESARPIEFRTDRGNDHALGQTEPFQLKDLQLNPEQIRQVTAAFDALGFHRKNDGIQ